MLTPLGRELRRLRLDRNWLLKDMADGIGVSPSFLSGVETGRKSLPDGMLAKVRKWGNLTPEEAQRLETAADQSTKEVRIKAPSHFSSEDREALAVLARKFGELDDEQRERFRALIMEG